MASKKLMISGIFLAAAVSMALASMLWWYSSYYYVLEPLGRGFH